MNPDINDIETSIPVDASDEERIRSDKLSKDVEAVMRKMYPTPDLLSPINKDENETQFHSDNFGES